MTTKLAQIYQLTEQRLEATGHPLVLGRKVDAKSDPFPCLMYLPHPENGIKTNEKDTDTPSPEAKREHLHLVVKAFLKYEETENYLFAFEAIYEEIREQLFPEEDREYGQYFGGLAIDYPIQLERNSYMREGSAVAVMDIIIRIPFLEDY